MTIAQATYYLLNNLRKIYPEGESSQITDWIMEHISGSKKAERMIYKNSAITDKEELQLMSYAERLLHHEPVQYILNESWFCGLKFYVDKNVLIPRPETEELVNWVVKEVKNQKPEVGKMLDIGTGSGCIAIALKNKLPSAEVWACDKSDQALLIARKNADDLNALVNFVPVDFLDISQQKQLPLVDIIVSNPPYVPEKDKKEMQPNVLNHEPSIALFVPDNDALLFYKAIIEFGKRHLNHQGKIYVEIHEDSGDAVLQLFMENNYSAELKKDMQGKNRMIKAVFSL